MSQYHWYVFRSTCLLCSPRIHVGLSLDLSSSLYDLANFCPTAIYSHPAEYLVMPLENTIHGSVTDTIDCLLSPLLSKSLSGNENSEASSSGTSKSPSHGLYAERPLVIGETVLKIQHCLVVKKGVQMKDIKWVRSHEQVCLHPASQIPLPNSCV